MLRKIAIGWMMLGALGVGFIAVFAFAHYVFSVPVHEGHSTIQASAESILRTIIALTAGSTFFLLLGAALYRFAKLHG
jgi:hypothetical protein